MWATTTCAQPSSQRPKHDPTSQSKRPRHPKPWPGLRVGGRRQLGRRSAPAALEGLHLPAWVLDLAVGDGPVGVLGPLLGDLVLVASNVLVAVVIIVGRLGQCGEQPRSVGAHELECHRSPGAEQKGMGGRLCDGPASRGGRPRAPGERPGSGHPLRGCVDPVMRLAPRLSRPRAVAAAAARRTTCERRRGLG